MTGSTYDIATPSLLSVNPPNIANVGINVTPVFTFNKPLNPITVNNVAFRMYMQDTNQFIPLNVTPSANGLTVTLQPLIPLLNQRRWADY